MAEAELVIKLKVEYDPSVGIEVIKDFLQTGFREGRELTTTWQDSEFTILKSRVRITNYGT